MTVGDIFKDLTKFQKYLQKDLKMFVKKSEMKSVLSEFLINLYKI